MARCLSPTPAHGSGEGANAGYRAAVAGLNVYLLSMCGYTEAQWSLHLELDTLGFGNCCAAESKLLHLLEAVPHCRVTIRLQLKVGAEAC